MKNQLLIVAAILIFIELFLLRNFAVLFLLVAIAAYLYSFKKGDKSFAGLALVFFVIAILSMRTVVWIVPIIAIYWLYVRYWRKDTYAYGTSETPYAWQDVTVTKLFGPITVDTTNTILPLEPTFISVVQGVGRTVITVPYDVTCTIHVSQGLGKFHVNGVQTFKNRLELESDSRRRMMIHVTNGFGEVEIWQK
jgi:predicted membrane protein